MEYIKKHLKIYHITSVLGIVVIAFAAMNFNGPPLFNSLDNFVLFAQEEIKLEKQVQISSGDLGSNKEIDIDKDAIISGNLFADEIEIDKNTQINGNVSFNKLKTEKDTKILGTQTKPVQLPVAKLPEIPDFQIGTQDFKFKNKENTLVAGSYRDLTLEKDGKLVLSGGTYNINRLFLKENSTLIFSAPTTLNIKKELKSQQHVAVLPGTNNLKPMDLTINYAGKSDDLSVNNSSSFISRLLSGLRSFFKLNSASSAVKQDKNANDNKDKEKAEVKEEEEKEEGNKPIEFGKNSFLNFKLLAPKAAVHIGESSTMRGQILARKIKIEKDTVLSREEVFSKDTDLNKIVTVEGEKFPVNEVIIVLKDEASFSDAQAIVDFIKGRIVGFIPVPSIYKVEVSAATALELDNLISQLLTKQNPLILFVTKNIAGGLR